MIAQQPSGVIVLDKPAGITSARAVAIVKRMLPRGTKIGHAGTLDPFATGVLLLLVGKATKSCEQLMGETKTYETIVKFGSTTETDDPESPEIPRPGRGLVSIHDINVTIRSFVGAIEQRPPRFSAIKIAGRRACDRVRAGEVVEMKSRIVQVHSIDVIEFDWPFLKLNIVCGRGTYIRSIARDMGESLGVGGYLTQLRRTRIGAFSIDDAVALDQLSSKKISPFLRQV